MILTLETFSPSENRLAESKDDLNLMMTTTLKNNKARVTQPLLKMWSLSLTKINSRWETPMLRKCRPLGDL